MIYYQEITLLPTAEIGLYFLWQKIYKQIHLALVENKIADNASAIGLSFPEYDAEKFSLGKILRLITKDEQLLKNLQCDKWLIRLKDYLYISQIKPIPEKLVGYACFKHIKLNGNKEKLARRRAKRTGETLEQALEYFKDFKEQHSNLPFIQARSETNGHHFRLFIEKLMFDQPKDGVYSCYGLSNESTVPLF